MSTAHDFARAADGSAAVRPNVCVLAPSLGYGTTGRLLLPTPIFMHR